MCVHEQFFTEWNLYTYYDEKYYAEVQLDFVL